MIWTILLIVLITGAALLCILVSLILFPVFTFGIYAVLRPENKMVLVEGSWLHPRIVTFTLNPINRDISLTFLGRRLLGSKSTHSSIKPENVSETESSSAQASQGIREEFSGNNEIEDFEVVSSRPEPEVLRKKVEGKVEGKVEAEYKVEDKGSIRNKKKYKDKNSKDEAKSKTVKGGFISRLKKNRYFYIIRQQKLQKRLFRWVFRVFKSLFKVIRFNHFDTSIKAGIEEPALLGNVYAFYTMTRYTVNMSGGEPIVKFEPVFMKNWFEGEGRFSLKTSVISLIWPALIAVTSFPYITVIWLFWKSRKLKVKTAEKS